MNTDTKGGGGENVKASQVEKQKGGMTRGADGESAVMRQCWRREV